VPELSYGENSRLPSASSGIDLQFSPDKGRYFIATQDLSPGNNNFSSLFYVVLKSNLQGIETTL
jgi:hypothetical protein